MTRNGLCLVLVLSWLVFTPPVQAVTVAPTLQSRAGMVTAAHPLAARAGAEILEKGGNAVDAAIAVSLALGVVEPYASGLGGEGYMVAVMADGRELAIDFRSVAPALANYDNLAKAGNLRDVRYTPKGYCVAGVPAGIGQALKWARLPLETLAGPAIRLAEDGFEVNETFASVNMDRWEILYQNAPEFLNDGMPWTAGETFRNPELARTMKIMAGKGVDAFYRGELANSLVRFMKENDGWVRKSDLKAYRALARAPIKGYYRGYELSVPGSPVGGPRILATLNILEHFNLGLMGWDDPLAIHIMQEAMILTSLDQRRWLGDPETNDYIPEKGYVSKQYARQRMMLIDLARASDPETWRQERVGDPGPYEAGGNYVEVMLEAREEPVIEGEIQDTPPSTTHFSVVDREGNAVAWTQTISSFFGTGNLVDGYFLNNELGNFKSAPVEGSPINLEPGRRPRTTIAPLVVKKDGNVRWVIGSPGAGRIGSTIIEILVNVIDFGMDLEQAIRTPKFTGYDAYSEIQLEDEFPDKTVRFLEQMGHVVKEYDHPDLYFGGPNAIEVGSDGTLTGVGSIRRNGGAAAPGGGFTPDIRPGEGVTEQKKLSDYFPPLAGTNLDSDVFILDSGKAGATGLMVGGTHGNELAGTVSALVALENVVVRNGKLVVIPYANSSAIEVRDSRMQIDRRLAVQSRSGERYLAYGDRRTAIGDQGQKDPDIYENPMGYALDNGAESRNLNRSYPGKADGTPTEQLAFAIMALVEQEGVDFSLDMHEADTPERKVQDDGDYRPGGNKRLAYTLVAHPRGLEVAAFALLALEEDTGISMKLEESNSTYRGLSHIEIGDATSALSFLSESPNPGQDRWRDEPDVVTDPKYPLSHRVGLHLRLFKSLADAYADLNGEALEMDRLPEYRELMAAGIGTYLN
ncbi:MAG: gamma-glutamyltransferase [Xanthomonadales bacterium]|nr:gamma-glutamyltransferase [Xanthomonadales bacterium]